MLFRPQDGLAARYGYKKIGKLQLTLCGRCAGDCDFPRPDDLPPVYIIGVRPGEVYEFRENNIRVKPFLTGGDLPNGAGDTAMGNGEPAHERRGVYATGAFEPNMTAGRRAEKDGKACNIPFCRVVFTFFHLAARQPDNGRVSAVVPGFEQAAVRLCPSLNRLPFAGRCAARRMQFNLRSAGNGGLT